MLRIAYKKRIQNNPFSLSGDLYPLVDNGHGGYNEDTDATPEVKSYTNDVRISHLKKGIKQSGTADIADEHNLMAGQTHFLERLIQGMGDAFMGTARTENRRPCGI